MSHISDSSSRTLNDLAPQSSTPQSAAALGSSEEGGALKKLKFNEHGLPIGENSTKSSSRLGYLSRTHIPVRYAAWPKVPKCYKDQLWNAYKAEYPDVKDCQRGLFMRKASGAWKKFKGKLRVNLVGDDVTKWKEYVPNNVKSDDWEAYCDHEATLSQREVRKRNKAIKNSSDRKSTHNTGRNGYARSAEKWENENGRPPTRAELWLYTHKKKDGTYAPHDQEFAAKVEMLLKVHKGKCNEETLDSGPIYEIFGKDKGGSVRCVGSTVSRRSLLASAFAREMLKEVTEERDNWVEDVGTLKKEMDSVKSTLTEFISNFRSGKFVTDDNDDNDNDNFKSGKFVTDDNDGNDNDNDSDSDSDSDNDNDNGNDNDNDNDNDNMPISPTFATPTSDHQFSSLNDLTPYGVQSHVTEIPGYSGCEIRSHTNEIVGYGRKAKLGAVSSVHGRQLGTREVPVLLDKILVPNYLLWGGKQGHCSTLADVGVGGFMCWHDDYVPSLDDTL